MIALLGFSRFPIIFSSEGKILGARSGLKCFDEYIQSLSQEISDKAVALMSIPKFKYRYYVVLDKIAINPINFERFKVPHKIFVFPSMDPDNFSKYSYYYGFYVKVRGFKVFVPLISIKKLKADEIEFFKRITKSRIKSLGEIINTNEFIDLLKILNIEVLRKYSLADGIVFHIFDNETKQNFYAYLDNKGMLIDTNICVSWQGDISLIDLIMLVRREGEVVIYDPREYEWFRE